LSIVKAKDNKVGWLATVAIHIILLLSIIFSKGCMELQNPPQFTLEEVAILDFSGGGSEGAKSSEVDEESSSESSEEEVTQVEESLIQTNTGTNNAEQESENISEDPEAKYDLTNPFGGEGNAETGNGTGERTGIGDGDGDDINTGGGLGDGDRQGTLKDSLDNSYNLEGFLMVEFIIDRNGNIISTTVLQPHDKTTVKTLSNKQKKFIADDCKNKFEFTPSSSANKQDRVFKRMTYVLY